MDDQTLFISGIPKETCTKFDLINLFSRVAQVERVWICKEKGFGFLTLFDKSSVDFIRKQDWSLNGSRLQLKRKRKSATKPRNTSDKHLGKSNADLNVRTQKNTTKKIKTYKDIKNAHTEFWKDIPHERSKPVTPRKHKQRKKQKDIVTTHTNKTNRSSRKHKKVSKRRKRHKHEEGPGASYTVIYTRRLSCENQQDKSDETIRNLNSSMATTNLCETNSNSEKSDSDDQRQSPTVPVYVNSTSSPYLIHAHQDSLLTSIQNEVWNHDRIPSDNILLSYDGKVLSTTSLPPNLEPYSTIHVTVKGKGGMRAIDDNREEPETPAMPAQRGSLLPEDEWKINQNFSLIVRNVEAENLADSFVDAGLFEMTYIEDIMSTKIILEKNRLFLRYMCKSGPGAYRIFIETLRTKGYDSVANTIEATPPKSIGIQINSLESSNLKMAARRLNPDDEYKIRHNYLDIEKNISAKQVMDYFVDDGIFDQDDIETITSKTTTREQNRAFIDCVCKSGPTAYTIFMKTLRHEGYGQLVDKLEATKPNSTTHAEYPGVQKQDMNFKLFPEKLREETCAELQTMSPEHTGGKISIDWSLINQTESWIREEKLKQSIPVFAFEIGKKILVQKKCLIIRGNSGDGKTHLALQLLIWLQEDHETDGNIQISQKKPIYLSELKNWDEKVHSNCNLAILIDDLFGYGSDPECDINWWIRQERLIRSLIQGEVSHDANCLIITLRSDIYNEFKSTLETVQSIFSRENVVDLSSPDFQIETEKKSILNMYLSQIRDSRFIKNLDVDEIINTPVSLGFPEACRIFITTPELQAEGVHFFKNPLYHLQCIIKEKCNVQKKRALLFLLLSLGKVAHDSLETESTKLDQILIEKTFAIELPPNISQNLFPDISSKITCLKQNLKALCGSFVKFDKDTGNYIFSHDSVLDAVTVFYGEVSPVSFLKNCNCNCFRYIVTEECKNAVGKIVIQHYLFPYIYRRIVNEVLSNNVEIYSLLASLTLWEDECFLSEFFSWIDKKEENVQKEFYFLPRIEKNSSTQEEHNDITSKSGHHSFFVSIAKVNNHALLKGFIERSSKSNIQMKLALDESLSAGRMECVTLLLDKGIEPDEKSVFSAVESGNIKLLEKLIPYRAIPTAKSEKSRTHVSKYQDINILHEACLYQGRRNDMVELLIKTYPSLCYEKDKHETSILHFLAMVNDLSLYKIVEKIILSGKTDTECQHYMMELTESSEGKSVLHFACLNENVELYEYLCQTFPILLSMQDVDGRHCLHEAAKVGDIYCFQYLESLVLKDKTDAEHQRYMEQLTASSTDETVLHVACLNGKKEVYKYLCTKYPFMLSQRSKNGWHCLHFAAKSGNVDCYKYLESFVLKDKTNVECLHYIERLTECLYNRNVLHIACFYGETQICKYLYTKYPSMLSQRDKKGSHCLHLAAQSGNVDCYKYLESLVLKDKTDVECKHYIVQFDKFSQDKTVLHAASYSGKTEVCKYLYTKYPSMLSQRDKNGWLCLHLAAHSGNVDCYKYLESLVFKDKSVVDSQHYMEQLTESLNDMTVLHIACLYGKTEICKYLYTKYPSLLSQIDKDGRHCLHLAAISGNVDRYKYLESLVLKDKSDVECQHYMEQLTEFSSDMTVLHIACLNGKTEVCKYLCTKYPFILSQRNKNSLHCLHLAAQSGNIDCYMYLESLVLKDKTDVECLHYMEQLTESLYDRTVLHIACDNGETEVCKYLCTKYPSMLSQADKNGCHCIHLAGVSGNVDCYKYLEALVLKDKSDDECQYYMEQLTESLYHMTVLHIVCLNGKIEVCKYLYTTYPSMLSQRDKNGWHCLHFTAQSGNVDCYKYLESLVLEDKSDVECQHYMELLIESSSDMTVLHIACLNGKTEVCTYLCTMYPSLLSQRSKNGWHCLHFAAQSGSIDCYKYLESLVLKDKTDVDCQHYMEQLIESSSDMTVLHIACLNGTIEVSKYLCSKYPSMLSQRSKNGWHCFHSAALSGNIDCYNYLESLVLKDKRDAECQHYMEKLTESLSDRTVLHIACLNGKTEVCKYLCTRYPCLLSQRNMNGWHCLHFAAVSGNVDSYMYLESLVLKTKSDVECQRYMEQLTELSSDRTVLHIACLKGRTEVCKYLYTKYPSMLSQKTKNGWHCLHFAAQSGNTDCYKYLESIVLLDKVECQQYMRTLKESSEDKNVLHVACLYGNTELCGYLCDTFPSLLTEKGKYRWRCLHYVALSGNVTCYQYIQSLLLKGKTQAEIISYMGKFIKCSPNKSILSIADRNGKEELYRYLRTEYPDLLPKEKKSHCIIS